MSQYSASEGKAGDWHLMHLGQLAISGAGLLTIEATAVEAEGRTSLADLGLWNNATAQALGGVVQKLRSFARVPLTIQLCHAGRKASVTKLWDGGQQLSQADGGWLTVAPSSVPFRASDTVPVALDRPGMERIRDAFVQAALRADRIGIDAVEMHAAHGVLLHQFLSPVSNLRSDEYGGPLQNRMRFPLEVIAAVRAAFPSHKPVGVRLSVTDWVPGGWDIEEAVVFARAVEALGCDYIHVSSGGLSAAQQIPLGPGYQVQFAERIKRAVGLPTTAVGLITEAGQAEEILAAGRADLIAVGRAILFNPRWPWQAAHQLAGQVQAPRQYWRAMPTGSTIFKQ